MSISRDEVRTVAKLARLSLNEESLERLSQDVSKILEYVKVLDQLDTSDVELTAQVGAQAALFRADVVAPGVSKAEVLGAAPRADERGFLVPAFVDEGGKTG